MRRWHPSTWTTSWWSRPTGSLSVKSAGISSLHSTWTEYVAPFQWFCFEKCRGVVCRACEFLYESYFHLSRSKEYGCLGLQILQDFWCRYVHTAAMSETLVIYIKKGTEMTSRRPCGNYLTRHLGCHTRQHLTGF